jgi:hypothetical protein
VRAAHPTECHFCAHDNEHSIIAAYARNHCVCNEWIAPKANGFWFIPPKAIAQQNVKVYAFVAKFI